MVNLLVEFEKRYFGNPAATEEICEDIARTYNLDPEFVKDYVYINRYENLPGDEEEEEPDTTHLTGGANIGMYDVG